MAGVEGREMNSSTKDLLNRLEDCEGMTPAAACEKINVDLVCYNSGRNCHECPLENVSVMLELINSGVKN